MSEPLNIGLRLGAMEIGTMLSSVLLGVTTVQLYMYYTKNYQDPLWLRAFVLFIWLLEITLTLLNWEYLYHLTVTNYGKPPDLDRTPWTINIHTLFVGLSGSLVQMYFTYRLRALSRTLVLPVLAWTGSALHLIGSIFTVAFLSRMSIDRLESQAYRWSIICTLIFDLFVDILNTVGLSMWLYAQKQQNDLPRMNHIVNKLIKWTVQTGLITSIAASLMLILYLALPDTYLWLSISWFYTKLYSNNLLALFVFPLPSSNRLPITFDRQYAQKSVMVGSTVVIHSGIAKSDRPSLVPQGRSRSVSLPPRTRTKRRHTR